MRRNEFFRAGVLYGLLAAALMWPNLLHLRTATVYPYGDGVQMIWASGWVAHAFTHFRNPFFSPFLMSPHGTNLLASPCAVGLAILDTLITLLLGPVATFNVQLFLMPVLSALAMVYALREIVRSPLARVIGGLVWGFSPFVLSCLNTGWTNIGFLFFPPLLISIVLDELYFHRRSSFRNGLAAGMLIALQLTVGSEIIANTFFILALCGAPALLVAVVRSEDFRRRLFTQVRPFAESGTAMVEQARNGFRFYTPGSFGPAAINVPKDERDVVAYFTDLVRSGGTVKQDVSRAKRIAIRKVFSKWGVDYIVVPVRMQHMIAGFPEIMHFQERMTLLYGVPKIVRGSFVWDTSDFIAPTRLPSSLRVLFCEDLWSRHPEQMPACYLS